MATSSTLRSVRRPQFLINDRDSKLCSPFDEVFRSEGMRIVRTPIRAPKANAVCERWVGTFRAECLDWTLILGRRHLERIFRSYIGHDNEARPIGAWRSGRRSAAHRKPSVT